MKEYDLVVLGWGKAGKTLAAKMAKQGKKVAIVEKDPKMYGGTCINVGCLPTKSLANSAHLIHEMTKLGLEINYDVNNAYFKKAMEEKIILVNKLNNKNYGLLADNPNVDVYNGEAKFISNKEIKVGDEVLTSQNIVINTGSESRKLNIPGIDNDKIGYSNEILNLKELPKKLLVYGSGFIGLEFASMFSSFGSEVSVFQFDNTFLPSEDEKDAEFVKTVLENKGIKFSFSSPILKFEDGDRVKVKYSKDGEEKEEEFDFVLISAGRVPNINGLGLENTDIELTDRKEIKVNDNLETSVKGIWAAGDVKGGPQFTYVSLDDSRIILPQLLGKSTHRTLKDRSLIPTSTFIEPPYSRVGLNEKEATKLGVEYSVKYMLTAGIPKAHVLRETEGFSKVLVNKEDEIIGAVMFNSESHEIINLLALAISEKIKSSVLRDYIYTHPTLTESLNDLMV